MAGSYRQQVVQADADRLIPATRSQVVLLDVNDSTGVFIPTVKWHSCIETDFKKVIVYHNNNICEDPRFLTTFAGSSLLIF
jgi:hypothetical protein